MSAIQTSVADQTNPPAGTPSDTNDAEIDSYVQAEASAEIAFGTMISDDGSGGCVKLAATSDAIGGVLVLRHTYEPRTELGTTGLKPTVAADVMTEGRMWVKIEETVTRGDPVRYRCVVAGNEVAGAFRTSADSTDCVLIEQGARWVTGGTASEGVAELEFDLVSMQLNPD